MRKFDVGCFDYYAYYVYVNDMREMRMRRVARLEPFYHLIVHFFLAREYYVMLFLGVLELFRLGLYPDVSVQYVKHSIF